MERNQGYGAGGKNTNVNGKGFEKRTDITNFLCENGFWYFIDENFKFLVYNKNNIIIFHFIQNAFDKFMKGRYGIETLRTPDEAFLILKDKKKIIKIIEKKNQNVEGSVDLKLFTGSFMRREYELNFGEEFKFEYIFVLSDFFKKRYKTKDTTKDTKLSKNKQKQKKKYNIHK